MATAASSQSADQWFVRQGTKIRGPFSLAVLVSMKERGRLDATTQISSDRLHWVAAQTVSELFGESDDNAVYGGQQAIVPAVQMPPSLPESQATGPAEIIDALSKCFYSIDGIVHGPVSLAALRQRALSGQLAPSDYVWIEGSPDWLPALSVAALRVATHGQRAMSFLRSNAVLVSCIVCMALLALGLPTWYVFASSRQQQKENEAKELADKEARREELERRKEELARQERERDRLFEHERALVSERNQVQSQLETLRLSYAQLRAQKIRDEETERMERRMDELKAKLDSLDTKLSGTHDAASKPKGGRLVKKMWSCSACGGSGQSLTDRLAGVKCRRCGGSGQHVEDVWEDN